MVTFGFGWLKVVMGGNGVEAVGFGWLGVVVSGYG